MMLLISIIAFFPTISINKIGSEIIVNDAMLNASNLAIWSYYRVINLYNTCNEYQMLINVSKKPGRDVDYNGHCKYDFDDIRFYDILSPLRLN